MTNTVTNERRAPLPRFVSSRSPKNRCFSLRARVIEALCARVKNYTQAGDLQQNVDWSRRPLYIGPGVLLSQGSCWLRRVLPPYKTPRHTRVYSRFPARVLRPWMDFARIRRPPDGCTPTQLDLCARYRCVGVSAAMQRVSMDKQLARHLLRTIEPQQERLRLRLRAIQCVRKPTYERRKKLAASRRNRSKRRKSKSKNGE